MNIQAAGVFLRILLMLPITVLLATVPASAADRFSGSTYTITVPDGWVRIPPYLVTRQLGDFSRNRVLFPVAFQLESDKTWFSYPYVIIQTYDYPEGTEPTDTWIKQFAQQAGGSDPTPQVDLSQSQLCDHHATERKGHRSGDRADQWPHWAHAGRKDKRLCTR